MGKVYGPEDVMPRRGNAVPDFPKTLPRSDADRRIEQLSQDLSEIRAELERIKQALRAHGIAIQ